MKRAARRPGRGGAASTSTSAPRRSIGIHWGTFELTDESLDEPPRALARARQARGVADDAFFVLAIGETRRLAPRRPQP